MQTEANSCTSLVVYRQHRKFETAREELIAAVVVLQDAEIHILRAQVEMEEAGGTHLAILEDLRERASEAQFAAAQCSGFVTVLSMRLGYDNPLAGGLAYSEDDPES